MAQIVPVVMCGGAPLAGFVQRPAETVRPVGSQSSVPAVAAYGPCLVGQAWFSPLKNSSVGRALNRSRS
jgi:hypothetical protein